MVHNLKEWRKDRLAYETYKRVPYLKDTVYEIIDAFFVVLHQAMLDKQQIRLYKIGTLRPRVRKARRKFGWDTDKVYDIERLWYCFKESYAFKNELAKVLKESKDDDTEGGAS